jgi:hypothetical protein
MIEAVGNMGLLLNVCQKTRTCLMPNLCPVLIENQCSSTPLHYTSRRQDAALAFNLCASRVIVMCDSPSASSSFRIEVA